MPKCDIVIPVWNQLEVTKKCLDSLSKNTKISYHLILIDNASENDTKEYLSTYKVSSPHEVSVIRNNENLGFIKAVNIGFKIAKSEYVCVLNNDTILASGWLEEIIKVMDENPKIGVANPSSNNLGQRIPANISIDEYAESFKKFTGQFVELMSCIGFAMVIRRKLFEIVGYFDEIYGMGNFEDTDFCMRVKKHGYLAVRVISSYVYHMENTSFKMFKKYRPEFEKNKSIFESRWGRPKRILFAIRGEKLKSGSVICEKIKEEIRNNNWVMVITPLKKIFCSLNNYAGLTICNTSNFFYIFKVIMKVLFKKKKFDIIYTDNGTVFTFIRVLKVFKKVDLIII